jgi:hypothetical protein
MANPVEQDYKTRFTFHLSYFDGVVATELSTLNFYAQPREFANPDLAVENSWQIVDAFAEITGLFQKYMKSITMDFMQKQIDSEIELKATVSPYAQYVFKLIDHSASVRVNDKLTQEKEVRVIYEHRISAADFCVTNPLSIIPIWKDFEQNGVQKDGIRTILKDLLLYSKYESRFKTSRNVLNTYCVNSFDL